MIDIELWTHEFIQALNRVFGDRIWFVGLQGSYGRGEATDSSDLDMVVILDELNSADIVAYNDLLDTMPDRALICGFLSGKSEILNWEPSDLFQFFHDTKPLVGNLDDLLSILDSQSVTRAIKSGVCNIYHGCVHNMLFDKSEEVLKGLYKAASFVVQAICYRETGKYYMHQKDLLNSVSFHDKTIINTFLKIKNGEQVCFQTMSELLFNWSKYWINRT